MILNIFQLIIALAIPTLAGFSTLTFILKKRIFINIAFTLALSYGLGFGLLTQWMLLLGSLKISYNFINISTPLIVYSLILLIRFKQKKSPCLKSSSLNNSLSNNDPLPLFFLIILILYILYSINFVLWRSMNIPILEWDALSTVAFKAKIFFYEQTLNIKTLPHSSYPLQTPFALTWIAFNLNTWHEQLVKIIFPCTFLAYLSIHYTYIKNLTSNKWALIGTALLLSSNFFCYHASIAYRDFTMLYYNCTSIILILLWHQYKNNRILLLAALFSGFTTFTKLEGTGYLFIHTLLVGMILWKNKNNKTKKYIKSFLTFIIPSYGICLFYHLHKILLNMSGLSGRTALITKPDYLSRIFTILKEFSKNLFLSGNWNILWGVLLISLFLNFKKLQKNSTTQLLLTTLFLFFGLYFSIALLTSSFISIAGAESPTVLSRIILHFFPLATIIITLLNSKLIQENSL